MSKKSGLGRGLDSLIPGGTDNGKPAGGVSQIPVDQIAQNPRQPRTNFDQAEMDELAASVRQHGIIQPLLVTRGAAAGSGEQYTLIAGERRLLAARSAGLETVPAMIREATEQELVELALIENVQRADLSPLESAEAYRQLVEEFGLSHEDVAGRVGKSRVAVTNTLRLLKLPASVRQALAQGAITEGHARALLGLPSVQAQTAALQAIISRDLTVRQTEELVRKLTGEKPPRPSKRAVPPEVAELVSRLRARLGTKVSLHPRRKGGTVVIHYYSEEELDTIVGRITGEEM